MDSETLQEEPPKVAVLAEALKVAVLAEDLEVAVPVEDPEVATAAAPAVDPEADSQVFLELAQ